MFVCVRLCDCVSEHMRVFACVRLSDCVRVNVHEGIRVKFRQKMGIRKEMCTYTQINSLTYAKKGREQEK